MGKEDQILEILGMMQNNIDRLADNMQTTKNSVTCLQIDMENVVKPQIAELVDGQTGLRENLAPTVRVEELEDRLDFDEWIMRNLTADVDDIKRTQYINMNKEES